jgi:hypothetical protein
MGDSTPQKDAPKYGARVYFLDDDVMNVKQTVKKDTRYVVDCEGIDPKEEHISPGPDQAIEVFECLKRAAKGQLVAHKERAD